MLDPIEKPKTANSDENRGAISNLDGSDRLVCSYNEWDPLEEVIVGVIDGACVPEWHTVLDATMPEPSKDLFQRIAVEPLR